MNHQPLCLGLLRGTGISDGKQVKLLWQAGFEGFFVNLVAGV